ncbi:MAG: hypothetical protein Q8N44_19685 [Rubrivivax sp.]|nr:hypothetical protein [Rubrivivax sp.]
MSPDQEKQLLQGLYDRLFQAITYSPDGKAGVFDASTTLLQFAKNSAVVAADYLNQVTPINPNGDLNAAQQFSALVDDVPSVSLEFNPSGLKVSTTYKEIADGANTKATVNVDQQSTYDKAKAFLVQTTSIPSFSGKPTVTQGPTAIAQAYDDNQTAYVTAFSGYRVAQNGYDLTVPAQQRAWQAVAPALQLNVDKAWNNWVRQGKANVEEATNAMAATINNIVSAVIADSQQAVAPAVWKAASVVGDPPWLLSYPLPGDWAAGSAGATDFSFTSANKNTVSDSKFNSYGGGASFNSGLWKVGGSAEHKDGATSFHMDASNVSIHAKLAVVRVMRPWFNALLFRTDGWWLSGQAAGKVSNGSTTGNAAGMLPLIPVAFVVMSDVTISADFSADDKTHIESATSGSASVGWGPFSISAHASSQSSHDTEKATFDGGTIRVPGMQIVAWISAITPKSAPLGPP